MQELPNGWFALCALVFLLGLKHGLDADHLATIDGLTRYNARHRRRVARYCGLLFSLGHGMVVVAIAGGVAAGAAALQRTPPYWLEAAGASISIFFLALIGVVNLRAVLAAAPGQVVSTVGIRGRLLGRFTQIGQPLAIVLVGVLFAVSFDTVSQAALFAFSGAAFGGVERALLLGVLFAIGMIVTDGINGLWISGLIARTDRIAVIASRIMGSAIGGTSLLLAGLGAARLALPRVEAWSADKELVFSAVVVGVVVASYLLARRLAARDVADRLVSG